MWGLNTDWAPKHSFNRNDNANSNKNKDTLDVLKFRALALQEFKLQETPVLPGKRNLHLISCLVFAIFC